MAEPLGFRSNQEVSIDTEVQALTQSAERRWMANWTAGPSLEQRAVRRGEMAPDLELTNEDGSRVLLSETWAEKSALVMLWRHLGCGCGLDRLERLKTEYVDYESAGLNAVVVAPGDLKRVLAYKERYGLPVPVLADPDYATHNAFGLSHWSVEQVLYDAPDEYCTLSEEIGVEFQETRRGMGRPLVDDPWMQSGEFVVNPAGVVTVAYLYNYCEDYPDPRVFLTAARVG